MQPEAMAEAPNSLGCQVVSMYTDILTENEHTHLHIHTLTPDPLHPPPTATPPVIKHVIKPLFCTSPMILTFHLRPRGPPTPLRPLPTVESQMVLVLYTVAALPKARAPLSYDLPPVPNLPFTRPRIHIVCQSPPPSLHSPVQPETLTLPLRPLCLMPECPNSARSDRCHPSAVWTQSCPLVCLLVPHYSRMSVYPAQFHGTFPPPIDPVHHSCYCIRQAVNAPPLCPVFTTAVISCLELDNIHTGPRLQFRNISSIPATSLRPRRDSALTCGGASHLESPMICLTLYDDMRR